MASAPAAQPDPKEVAEEVRAFVYWVYTLGLEAHIVLRIPGQPEPYLSVVPDGECSAHLPL